MPQRRRRVSQRILRRRRIVALAVLIFILIISITLISSSCSKKEDEEIKGNNEKLNTSIVTTTGSNTGLVTDDNNNPVLSSYAGIISGSQTSTTTVSAGQIQNTGLTATTEDTLGETVQSIELTFYTCDIYVDETVMPYVTMLPDTADLSEKWESSDTSIAVVDGIGNITGVKPGVCYVTVTSVNNPAVYAEVKVNVKDENGIVPAVSVVPDTTSLVSNEQTVTTTVQPDDISSNSNPSEPVYIGGILIANKTYKLPEDYNPGLDSETETQFYALSNAAAEEGLSIWLASGFRSYSDQSRIYNNYVDSYGQASADTFSARPGHSEHQTGLAIDVNSIDDSFAGTPEAIWLENHAHEYGFIIRYPKGKEHITGYKYEPWHIRYLGVEKATEVYNSGLTLEEFLGITSEYQE